MENFGNTEENEQDKGYQKDSTPGPPNKLNRTGFSQCPTPCQIGSLFYALFLTAQITLLSLHIRPSALAVSILAAEYSVFSAICVLWYLASSIDPTDSVQILHAQAIANGEGFSRKKFKYFCYRCSTCVSRSAFHCRQCCRCVECFDHHCKWVNNCIGAKNYFQFIGLIVGIQIYLSLHFISNLGYIIWNAAKLKNFSWLFYSSIGVSISTFVLICLNSMLVAMHVYLITQKKSTIDMIKEKRKKNKIHPALKNKKESLQFIQYHSTNSNLSELKSIQDPSKPISVNKKFDQSYVPKTQSNSKLIK